MRKEVVGTTKNVAYMTKKYKRKILVGITSIAAGACVISACLMDSTGIAYKVGWSGLIVSLIWIGLFALANDMR